MKHSINQPRTISYQHGAIIKIKIKSTQHSKIYAYHVTNKNIAPSKITDDRQKKEGMPFGASPSLVAWESLNITLGCLGHPQAQALATPYSFIHCDLTQNLKTSITQNSTKPCDIRQYNKPNHYFKYCCKPIHILFLHCIYCIITSLWLIPPIQSIVSSKRAKQCIKNRICLKQDSLQ